MHATPTSRSALLALAAACGVASLVAGPAGAQTTGAFAIRGGSARSAVWNEAFGAVGGDADAGYWNPASLIRVDRPHLQATYHDVYGLGLAHYTSLDLAWRRGSETLSESGDTLYVTTRPADGWAYSVGIDVLALELESDSYNEFRPSVTVAAPMAGGGAVGASVRYLRASSSLREVSATGYAFDVGIHQPLTDRIDVGIWIQNLLARLSWKAGREEPQRRETGGAIAFRPASRIKLGAGAQGELGDSGIDRMSAAAEVEVLPGQWALMGGVASRRSGADREASARFGTWVEVQRIRADYAYVPEAETPGDTHQVTLLVRF